MRSWGIVFILFSCNALADSEAPAPQLPMELDNRGYITYTKDDMFNITSEAVQKREDVKLLLKNSETWLWRQTKSIGFDEAFIVPVASVAAPLIAHKISTRTIHLDWRPTNELTLRPDLDYYLDSKELQLAFTAIWRY